MHCLTPKQRRTLMHGEAQRVVVAEPLQHPPVGVRLVAEDELAIQVHKACNSRGRAGEGEGRSGVGGREPHLRSR